MGQWQETHFRFVQCVEVLSLENKVDEWVNCLDIVGGGKPIIDCYINGYGNMLEKQFAGETTQLNPSHRFVPWVLANNDLLQEDFENFVNYVCKAYTGSKVPEACKLLPAQHTNKLWNENPKTPLCLAHRISNFASSTHELIYDFKQSLSDQLNN